MPNRTDSRPHTIEIPGILDEPRSRRRRVVLAVLVVLALLFLDMIWVVVQVRGEMASVEADLRRGADALMTGDVDEAEASFIAAGHATAGADGLLGHPAPLIAGLLPWIRDDRQAVQHLIDSATLAADAGTTLTGAARRVGWQGGTLAGLSEGTGSLAGTLAAAGTEIRSASIQLRTAASILTDQTTNGLIGPVRKALIAGRTEVVERAGVLQAASDLAEVVPSLFQDGRRYLLVVQNPNEPRGTGGYMGYMGFLESREGNLDLRRFFRTPGDIVRRPVDAPADYTKRYEQYGALEDLRLANLSPDLPTAAGVTLQLAEQHGWGTFDGVIMVDPVWMRYMLEATGPVETPGWPDAITAENVVRVLARDVFLLNNGTASDRAQDQIGTAVWEAVQTRDVSGTAMAEALARASAERHLQVYSVHPEEEATLARLNVTGEAALGRNPLAVVWAAMASNKVGYFTDRSIDVDVTLDEDGTATVTTALRIENHAPDGPPGRLLGDGTDVPVGTWDSLVSLYMPEDIDGAPTIESSGGGLRGVGTEFGHAVSFGKVSAAPGSRETWSVTYVAPNAVVSSEGGSEYRLDFLPQASLVPVPVSVQIHLAPGTSVTGTAPGMRTDGQTATFAGQPSTAQGIWVRFT